jgi:AbrB family looped-hinge helix DNA binding protein
MIHKAKVTSKGQITIPAAVRDAMGLRLGERVVFFEGQNGEFILRRVGSIMELAGCLAGLELPKTDAEMNEMIAAYAVELDENTKSSARMMPDGEAA